MRKSVVAVLFPLLLASPGAARATDIENWYQATTTGPGYILGSSFTFTFYVWGNWTGEVVPSTPASNWITAIRIDSSTVYYPGSVMMCGPIPTDNTGQTGIVQVSGSVTPGYHGVELWCYLNKGSPCYDYEMTAFTQAIPAYTAPTVTIVPYNGN